MKVLFLTSAIIFLGYNLIWIITLVKREALRGAIQKRNLEKVKRLAASGMNLNFTYTGYFGIGIGSPLSLTFTINDRSFDDVLIWYGASISPKSIGNRGLLTSAVAGGNFELIDLALASGHDIHLRPFPKSSTPLARAIHRQSLPMARFLISRGAGKEDLTTGDCRWHRMNRKPYCSLRNWALKCLKTF